MGALAALVGPASALALEKGVQTDLTWGADSSAQDRTMAGVQDLGAGWVRLTLAWHDVESRGKGRYTSSELTRYDTAIAKADAPGVKIIVAVHSSPNWASGTSQREAPPLNPADFADFMRFVADRYRGKVDAWELWNEENTQTFWPTGKDPARYAQLLKAGYPAVKAADPNATVLYGGTWNNDYPFLEAVYAAEPNIGDYFDALATHPYVGKTPPDQVWYDPNGRVSMYSFAGYRELRQTMLNHGDDKPIWFTEFGWSSYNGDWGVSEATQAQYLSRAYTCAEQDPYVNVAIWYAFRNHLFGADAQSWEDQLGLTRTDFSQKPAYGAFKAYNSGAGGCTYGYPGQPGGGSAPDPGTNPAPNPGTGPGGTTTNADGTPSGDAGDEGTTPEGTQSIPYREPVTEGSPVRRVRLDLRVRIVRSTGALTANRIATTRGTARVAILGRVRHVERGRVILRLQRRVDGGRWHAAGRASLGVDDNGRFSRRMKLAQGRWRVRAEYRAEATSKSRSRLVYFRG